MGTSAFAEFARIDTMRRAEIESQNENLLKQQRDFRRAADVVVDAWTEFAEVEAVAVIGSVARRLWKEIPRFCEFREACIEVWHECGDLDLALWISSQERLGVLRRAAGLALRDALEAGKGVRVASSQLDIFLIEPGTDRYLVRLCHFNQCPKGKRECEVPGCGAVAFNRHFPDFTPNADLLAGAESAMLYRRGQGRLRSALDLPSVERD